MLSAKCRDEAWGYRGRGEKFNDYVSSRTEYDI